MSGIVFDQDSDNPRISLENTVLGTWKLEYCNFVSVQSFFVVFTSHQMIKPGFMPFPLWLYGCFFFITCCSSELVPNQLDFRLVDIHPCQILVGVESQLSSTRNNRAIGQRPKCNRAKGKTCSPTFAVLYSRKSSYSFHKEMIPHTWIRVKQTPVSLNVFSPIRVFACFSKCHLVQCENSTLQSV